jgi:hypothetical protein
MLRILFVVIGYNNINGVLSADGDIDKMSKYMLRKVRISTQMAHNFIKL